MTIYFTFDERRAAQAAAYLLQLNGGRLDMLKLIKLLYVADRERLIKVGRSITGAEMVSMDHGPVLSEVYDLLKKRPSVGCWAEYIKPKTHDHIVALAVDTPESSALSKNDRLALKAAHEKYRDFEPFEIVDRLHAKDAPEWKNPGGSSRPIHAERIFELNKISLAKVSSFEECAKFTRGIAEIDEVG